MTDQESEFLRESNAIEGVFDDDSHMQAVNAWIYLIGQDELSPGVILKTHKILMLHQKLMPYHKGYFRDCDVRVGNRRCLSYKIVREFTEAWCEATMKLATVLNPIALHVAFEKIHPFVDGNGRLGRMLLNWTRIKLSHEPLLIIKADERQSYYDWFK